MFDVRMDKRYGRTVTLRLPEQLSLLRSPATEATHAFKRCVPVRPGTVRRIDSGLLDDGDRLPTLS